MHGLCSISASIDLDFICHLIYPCAIGYRVYRGPGNEPVKCPREHEVIVCGQFAQSGRELALVDQTTSLVDNRQREDSPAYRVLTLTCEFRFDLCLWGTYIMREVQELPRGHPVDKAAVARYIRRSRESLSRPALCQDSLWISCRCEPR